MKRQAKTKLQLLHPKREFEGMFAYSKLACGPADVALCYRAACVFLREERVSNTRKQCVVLRVSKADWERAGWADIVELVWIPMQGRAKERDKYVYWEPMFLTKNGETERDVTAARIHSFAAPRQVPDSSELRMGHDLFLQWLQGFCFCCNHPVHPPLKNQESVLRHLRLACSF